MADEKNESTGFKVVDRRNFTESGSRREEGDVPQREDSPSVLRSTTVKNAPAQAERRGPVPVGKREPEEEVEEPEGFGSFATLVSYLSTTAMFQLGLLPGPGGERIPTDFVNARRTIDLLEVLQEKTRGNLTEDESRMLEEVLYELRISFVEVQNHLTRKGQ